MPLTDTQIAQFRELGYLAVPQFFDTRELTAMRKEVARFLREGLLRNVATAGDGRTPSTAQRNLQLCPMYQHSSLFRALPFSEKVRSAVAALIGDPLQLQLDQIFLKPARDGSGTNWHQDNAYFQVRDATMGTAMWCAIDDATVANGTLHVIPRCFREPLPHSRDPYSDHHIRCYPPEEQAVPVEIPAGGVVFFYYGTPHATRGNQTDRDRAAVAYHFVRADHAPTDISAPDRKYHPILTGPQATGGLREYGVCVEGTWDAEVAQVLARPD